MSVTQSLTLTEVEVDKSTNTSKVRILWKSTQAGESWNGYTRTAKYYVSRNGGAETEYSVSYTLPQNATATIVDKTITVLHDSEGGGSVTVRTWMDTSISAGVVTQTKTLNLTSIPKASTLDALFCATAYFNGTLTYKYTPKTAKFYNRCLIALNLNGTLKTVKTINIGQKGASPQGSSFNFTESELYTIYNYLPSTKRGTLRFTLRTYSDGTYSTQVGDDVFKEITLNIFEDNATKPTATMTLTPVSNLLSPFNTLYIKGKSKVKVDLKNAAGMCGATITSCKVSVGSASGNAPYTSGYLNKAENVTITGTVKDSRGFTRKYTQTITVIDYGAPQIIPLSDESEVVAARCDENGNIVVDGTYLRIKAKRSYSKVVSGTQKNFCSIRYRYTVEGGSYSDWETILAADDASGDGVSTGALLNGILDATRTFLVQVQAVDTIGETGTTTITLPTLRVYIHKAGSINALGIGKYAEEENTVDVAEDITLKVRGDLVVGSTTIDDTGWIGLNLSDSVSKSEARYDFGRQQTGIWYRVVNRNHVYISFNCAFTFVGDQKQVNSDLIPSQYRPARNVIDICPVNNRAVARIITTHDGKVIIDFVQDLSTGTATNSYTVNWIDGYLDYWI